MLSQAELIKMHQESQKPDGTFPILHLRGVKTSVLLIFEGFQLVFVTVAMTDAAAAPSCPRVPAVVPIIQH